MRKGCGSNLCFASLVFDQLPNRVVDKPKLALFYWVEFVSISNPPSFWSSAMVRKLTICAVVFYLLLGSFAVSQDSLSDLNPIQSPVLGEPSAKSLADFRKSILEQAREIAKDPSLNLIERMQARANIRRLTVLASNKVSLEKMHQVCAENALSDGIAQSYGAIDWTKLAAFLKEMIPIILELIKLFAYNAPGQSYMVASRDYCPIWAIKDTRFDYVLAS